MGLIYFIEFIPDMRCICFRDRITGIKYRYSDFAVFLHHLHFDHHIAADMMACITYIISYNLLYFKLICPRIDVLFCVQHNLGTCLIRHDLHTLQNAFDQCRQIKSFKHDIFITEFQLVQCQQILDHLIHLGRLIHNNITVEFPTLRIFIDSFF